MSEEQTIVEPEKQPKKDDTDQKPSGQSKEPVLLKGEVKIFPDQPLPYLNRKEIKAYRAETHSGLKGFAMVCEAGRLPRADIAHKYIKSASAFLPKLGASGVVYWPEDRKEKYVFVYEDKLGKPVTAQKQSRALGIKTDTVISVILPNLVDAVFALHDRGVIHGGICLDNIYDGGTPNFEQAALGECLSYPEAYILPDLYVTGERAFADPLARGSFTIADDIYALGISIALMTAQHDFTDGMSAEEIALHKIDLGTFNLAATKNRFIGSINEFLRGTLDDDATSRWTIWDVKEWLDGRRVSGKQNSKLVVKSSRPMSYLKKNYFRPDILATQLHKDPAITSQIVENGDVYLWLNRSLQSKIHEEKFEEAVELVKKNSSLYSTAIERLASFVPMALSPALPIFFKGQSFYPDKLGNLLVDAIVNKKDINKYLDILSGDYVRVWSKFRTDFGMVVGEEAGKFETCRMYMLQKHAGYGLERCIYYLAPEAPCLSDKLRNFYVRSSADLLVALDKMAATKDKPGWFVDRHIIAFLFANDKTMIEPFSSDLNAAEKYRQISAVLKTFAKIQARDKMDPLPNLSSWISEHMGDLVKRYHDREERKRIKIEIDKMKNRGNLSQMAELFNNFQALQKDMKAFTISMQFFAALRKEYNRLSLELETNKNFGMETGRQTATIVSGVIAASVVLLYLAFSLTFR